MKRGHAAGRARPECTCALCRWHRERRLAELTREGLDSLIRVRNRCPSCRCTPLNRCVLDLGEGQLARCAAVGELAGHATCSACLTPHLRVPAALWRMPDAQTRNEMIRLGLIEPMPQPTQETPR